MGLIVLTEVITAKEAVTTGDIIETDIITSTKSIYFEGLKNLRKT